LNKIITKYAIHCSSAFCLFEFLAYFGNFLLNDLDWLQLERQGALRFENSADSGATRNHAVENENIFQKENERILKNS
jgi:hypothetical protein